MASLVLQFRAARLELSSESLPIIEMITIHLNFTYSVDQTYNLDRSSLISTARAIRFDQTLHDSALDVCKVFHSVVMQFK
jgi:hypothetical protein